MKIFPEFDYHITNVTDPAITWTQNKIYFQTILRREYNGEMYELNYTWHYASKDVDTESILDITQMFLTQAYAVMLTSEPSIYFPWKETMLRKASEYGESVGITEEERVSRIFKLGQ